MILNKWTPRQSVRRASAKYPYGLYYNKGFVSRTEREEILKWLSTIYPIWENRFSFNHPPPAGDQHRRLLRPVYWLGNWQFACLDYYRPPQGVQNRCIEAEPFPLILQKLVSKIESTTHKIFSEPDIPKNWALNTCLVNFYGSQIIDGKKLDTARVGEHKDFEPGPVASVSIGERAFFQFVSSQKVGQREGVVFQQWLDDGSLQIFGGSRWKKQTFHRVQRVDKKLGISFPLNVNQFETRRINFTFRYVPKEHWVRYSQLPQTHANDVREYMDLLSRNSPYFKNETLARKV